MRFSAVSVAFCLVAGVFALPAAPANDAGAPAGGSKDPVTAILSNTPAGTAASTLAGGAIGSAAGKRGLLEDVSLGGGCTKSDSPCNTPRPGPHPTTPPPSTSGGCPTHGCPTGPTEPTDCVGIIQSLLRELYPTLDITGHLLDFIVAKVLFILGADDLSYAVLHGRIGLLDDLLATLGCTVEELVLTIEKIVTGLKI